MKFSAYILLLCILTCNTVSLCAQVLDTICVEGNRQSNLAVPYSAATSWQWSITGGTIISNPDSNDVLIDWGSTRGLYPIEVVSLSANGCVGDTTKAYVYLTLPNFAHIEGPTRVCPGSPVTLTAYAGSSFAWQGGKTAQSIEFIAHKDTTVYLVALNGRCSNDTTSHTVIVEELPTISFEGPNDTIPIRSYQDFIIIGNTADSYQWLVNGYPVSNDPLYIHQFVQAGNHSVGLVAQFGTCTDTLFKNYLVHDAYEVFVPNAFTPNSDGINDVFLFKGVGIKSYTALVYNRWGGKIFEWNQTSVLEGWDGTMKDGTPAKTDTYLYKIFVTDYYGGERAYQGQFTLMR